MYTPLSVIEKKAKDHRLKNSSFIDNGKENFSDSDLSGGFCKLARKVNEIKDQLLTFHFTKNMISPITFTQQTNGFSCP
jgi:hypothetical protein